MNTICNLARTAMIGALLAGLTGCGGGGSDDPPQSSNPPPAPAPPAPPPPAPPPPDPVPPLSSVVIDLDGNPNVGVDRWPNGNTATGGQGEDVEGLPCLTPVPDTYHVHSHLAVFVDGVQTAVPANVGIHSQQPQRCFYTIHTHDKSGRIHIESGAPGTFTLGQMFAIWGQPLEADNFAGITGKPIVVYSTDQSVVTRVTTDWKAIELTSPKLLTIQIGTPITEIPNYNWSSN
jgi:hypothetical protein